MPFDAFLKLDNIPGECTDDKHKEWIEILSYNLGVSQSGGATRSTGGAAAGARADFMDFTVMKQLDKASPKLALFAANATHIPLVTLELCRATGDKTKYMEYKMSDCIVSQYMPSGSGGSDVPSEAVAFNFGKIEYTYTETDQKTGAAKGDIKSHWSLVENKGE